MKISDLSTKRRLTVLVLGLFGVAIGVLARQPVWEFLHGPPKSTPPQVKLPVEIAKPRPQVKPPSEIAKPHLTWAEHECERVIDEHIKTLDGFFGDAKRNTPAFAEAAVSWASKWRLLVDYVPYTKGGRHETFIRATFEKHVFTPTQVEKAVKQVVESYLREVKSVEGAMLVRVKADVAEFPAEYPIATFDEIRLEQIFQEAIEQAIRTVKSDVAASASLEVLSTVVGEVLTQAATELGVSAGILAAGAVLSWETFGIGLIVGVIVDAIISWVWDWYADPKGELAGKVNTKLDDIHRLIVNGSQEVRGLRIRLREVARERARVRETAILSVLQSH